MASSFDLDDLPPSRRFQHWRDMAENLFVPVSLKCDSPETFRSWWNGRHLGDVWLGTSLMTKLSVQHRQHHIAHSESDAVKVVVPLSGAIGIEQDKRQAIVRPGQIYIVDPVRPYDERIIEDLTFIWLHFPRAAVTSRVGKIERLTGVGFDETQPYAKLTADFIRSLSNLWDALDSSAAEHVTSVALDLLTSTLWERQEKLPSRTAMNRSVLLRQIKSFIDRNLTNPDLSMTIVAAALGLSTRYVHDLLSEAGFSYRHYVLQQRLAGCARDLADSRLAHRAVTSIAYCWGFFDGAHFSRAFKTAYGMSPRDFRESRRKR